MFAPKSTHKRKRSSARRDAAHTSPASSGRSIVSLAVPSTGDKGKADDLRTMIGAYPFSEDVSIVVPAEKDKEVNQLEKLLPEPSKCVSYRARISPCLFLDPIFATAYVKRGSLRALSEGSLEQDDVFCVDGRGNLYFSLTKDTYQTLGLQGQAYRESQKVSGRAADRRSGSAERFVITIDLRASAFTPGKAGYDRTLARLKAWDEARGDPECRGSWNVTMAWTDNDYPLGGQMQFPPRYVTPSEVERSIATRSVEQVEDVWIPKAESLTVLRNGWADDVATAQTRPSWDVWLEHLSTWSEWCAMSIMGAECIRTFNRPDDLNAYEVIEPREAGKVFVVRYKGFLPPLLGRQTADSLLDYLAGSTQSSFAHIRAKGAVDAPVCRTSVAAEDASAASSVLQAIDRFENDGSEESGEEDRQSGPKARKKRNEQLQKQSYNNPWHQGHQIRNPHSSCTSAGWQAYLFPPSPGLASHIDVEVLGDSIHS